MGAHFKHRARSLDVARAISKARIEEPGIVNAELPVGWIEGNDLRGEVRRNPHPYPRRENIEVTRLKNQALPGALIMQFPKFFGRVVTDLVQLNHGRVALRLVGNDFTLLDRFQIDRDPQTSIEQGFYRTVFVHVDERRRCVQLFNHAVASIGISPGEAQLTQPHSRPDSDGECPRDNLRIQFAFVSRRNTVEFDAVIGDQTSKNVQASRCALRIGFAPNVLRQIHFLEHRHDINAVFLKNRCARQVDPGHPKLFDFRFDRAIGSGEKAGSHPVSHISQTQVETRRLDMVWVYRLRGAYVSTGDEIADFLRGEYSREPALSLLNRRPPPFFKLTPPLLYCAHRQGSLSLFMALEM